jgi:hypothetical protein
MTKNMTSPIAFAQEKAEDDVVIYYPSEEKNFSVNFWIQLRRD